MQSLGLAQGKATVIGSSLKATPRFAAFVNGVSIHADDFDDTQLAVAKDRVYGLLTHPSVTTLPPGDANLAAADPKCRAQGHEACVLAVRPQRKHLPRDRQSRLAHGTD